MATRDTLRIADLFAWGALSAPGCIYPATQEVPHATPGRSEQDDLGGLLPWGCEQPEQERQDQA